MKRLLILLGAIAPLCLLAQTVDYPQWWFIQGVVGENRPPAPGELGHDPVTWDAFVAANQPPAPTDPDYQEWLDANHAPAQLGQLKNIATAAKAHVDAVLAPTTDEWDAAYAPHVNPFPLQPHADDHAPANQGQLKFLADGIYQVMEDQDVNLPADLATRSGGPWSEKRPWTADTADDENHAPVKLGALKFVFGFDITGFTTDADANGIPDTLDAEWIDIATNDPAWMDAIVNDTNKAYYDPDGIITATGDLLPVEPGDTTGLSSVQWDYDGDGISNLQEYRDGTDPHDFFNGQTATLYVWQGDGESAADGTYIDGRLHVLVKDADGEELENAPVRFDTVEGGNRLSLNPDADVAGRTATFYARSDYYGASVACAMPAPSGVDNNKSTVTASLPITGSASVTFTHYTVTPAQAARPRISNFTQTDHPGGSKTYTWTSQAEAGDWFQIERRQENGSWLPVFQTTYGSADLPILPGQTDFTLTLDVAYGQDRPNSPSGPSHLSVSGMPSFAVISIGNDHQRPIKVSNEGHVLLYRNYDLSYGRFHWGRNLSFDGFPKMNDNGEVAYAFTLGLEGFVNVRREGFVDGEFGLCFSNRYPYPSIDLIKYDKDGNRSVHDLPSFNIPNQAPEFIGIQGATVAAINTHGILFKVPAMIESECNVSRHTRYYDSSNGKTYGTDIELVFYVDGLPWPELTGKEVYIRGYNNNGVVWGSLFDFDGSDPSNSLDFYDNIHNTVNFRVSSINNNNLVLGILDEGSRYVLRNGDSNNFFTPNPGVPIDLMTPKDNEPLIVLCPQGFYVQKRNPQTGLLIPFSLGNEAFDYYDASEIVQSEQWSQFLFNDISDDGAFIVGTATNATTGQQHAVLLVALDVSIKDEAYDDNVVSTSDIDSDFDFIMVREDSAEEEEYKITLTPNSNLNVPTNILRYRLTGGTTADEPLNGETAGISISYHETDKTILEIGFDTNGSNSLDAVEVAQSVDIHALKWQLWDEVRDQAITDIRTMPIDNVLWDNEGYPASYAAEHFYVSRIEGPTDGIELIIEHKGGDNEIFEEIFGQSIQADGQRIGSLSVSGDYLVSDNRAVIYSVPSFGEDIMSDELWQEVATNLSYHLVHNESPDVTFKTKLKDDNTENHTVNSFMDSIKGAAEHLVTVASQGLKENVETLKIKKADPEQTPTIEDYEPIYQKLIVGGNVTGLLPLYESITGQQLVEGLTGGSQDEALAAENMLYWAQGTSRPNYTNIGTTNNPAPNAQDPSLYPSDYKVLDYNEFLSDSNFISVVNRDLNPKIFSQISATQEYQDRTTGQDFPMDTEQISFGIPKFLHSMGQFSVRSVGHAELAANGVSDGGTWRLDLQPDGRYKLTVKIKLQVFDIYDWDQYAVIEFPDGKGGKITIPDSWQAEFEEFDEDNWTGGKARPFQMGTKFTWPVIVIEVDIDPPPSG